MITINATNARKMLYKLIDDVNTSHDQIHITSKKGSAVMISEEDWSSIEETLHLSSIPGMAESIKNGMKEPLDKCSENIDW